MSHRHWKSVCRHGLAACSVFALVACGGGGGGGGTISTPSPQPAPSPSPAPAPSPTPTPAPTSNIPTDPAAYNTSEFRRSDGPEQHSAVSAWTQGYNGAGVTIAIVDTGIDIDSPEFAGRLSAASRDIYDENNNRGFNASDDHGTNVALVAAGGRNNAGVLGIAWGSTIMAIRADTPNSCVADTPQEGENDCSFGDGAIADAITHATQNGARVINLSLGGGGINSYLRNAIRDATAAGVVIVVASGNDGEAEIDGFAERFVTFGNGAVMVVGSVDQDGQISSFSNRAGANPEFFIAARGERVCCVYQNGSLYVDDQNRAYLFSGTSFSAPQVSGAVALLAQAFPNLSGPEIVEILLTSAFDAGAPGTDAIYGRGILDIAKAFAPSGTTSLAGGTTLPLGDTTLVGSQAMGDAPARASLAGVVLDKYGRAYDINVAANMRGAQLDYPLHGAIAAQRRNTSVANDDIALGFTIDASGSSGEMPRIEQLRLSRENEQAARVLASRAVMKLDGKTRAGFAYREGSDGIVSMMQQTDRPAFLIAGNAAGDDGMFLRADTAFALRRTLGAWGLTASAEMGEAMTASAFRRESLQGGQRLAGDVGTFGLSLDRRFGSLDTVFGLRVMDEQSTILGARFHEALGQGGARTFFADAEAGWDFAPGWRLGAAARAGFTRPDLNGVVSDGSQLFSQGWSFDIQRRGFFADGDALAFRVSQPLRVESGNLNLNLPVSYDYATLTPTYGVQRLTLTPEGREIMGEIAWRGPLFGGFGSASVYYRNEPGHYEALPSDQGVAFRWSRKF